MAEESMTDKLKKAMDSPEEVKEEKTEGKDKSAPLGVPQNSEVGGKVDSKTEVEKTAPKKREKEYEAVLNIYASFNNTIAHVTDMSGKTITKITGGMVTKHDRLKANPTIAMFISKRIAESVKDTGIKSFYVRIRAKTGNPAPGPGANAIIKSLTREGFRISNILDTTRVPRGGPKKKGGRRGRRV